MEMRIEEDDVLEFAILPARVALTAASDGTLKIWNAESGECTQTFAGHSDHYDGDADDDDESEDDDNSKCVNSVRFSADGTTVLTASSDGTGKIWDVETGACKQTFAGHSRLQSENGDLGGVNSAVFSADGAAVLTAGADGTAKIWSALTGECTQTFLSHSASSCISAAYSADGETVLATFADHTAKVWSTNTGECVQTLWGHRGALVSAVFSADGSAVLIASTDGAAKIWNTRTGEFTHTFAHGKPLSFAVFSADGTAVLTASCDGIAQIWSVTTGKCTQTLCPEADILGFRSAMVSAVFSSDGSVVLTASADEDLPAAHIWETETGKCTQTLSGHSRAVTSVAFAP